MSYEIANMLGIDVTCIMGHETTETFVEKIKNILKEYYGNDEIADLDWNQYLKNSMSPILYGGKGNHIVFSGIFNHEGFHYFSEIGIKISRIFRTTVMLMCYDKERCVIDCQVYKFGKELSERLNENVAAECEEIDLEEYHKNHATD